MTKYCLNNETEKTVIDFQAYRIERELEEKGVIIKRNNNNQVKMLLRIFNNVEKEKGLS